MAQFILVVDGISGAQLQKAMEVVNKSGDKLNLVPQASSGNQVQTPSMSSHKENKPNALEQYNHVRFEWNHEAAQLGAEIIQALAAN